VVADLVVAERALLDINLDHLDRHASGSVHRPIVAV
jgi:hypothetical protein